MQTLTGKVEITVDCESGGKYPQEMKPFSTQKVNLQQKNINLRLVKKFLYSRLLAYHGASEVEHHHTSKCKIAQNSQESFEKSHRNTSNRTHLDHYNSMSE